MGIKIGTFIKHKTFEVEGLTVTVRSLTARDELLANQEATKVKNLTEMLDKKAKKIEIKLEDHIEINQARLNIIKVVGCITEWDLETDDGKPAEINEANATALPQYIFDKILDEINSISFIPKESELKNSETPQQQ